jgi:hypothetical protein
LLLTFLLRLNTSHYIIEYINFINGVWLMKRCFLLIVCLLSIYKFAPAEYEANELCVIAWEGESYRLFSRMESFDPDTPETASDDYFHVTAGPHAVIVDMDENIIVASRDLRQLVGFDRSGEMIFNFSYKYSQYEPKISEYVPEDIYVDTLSRIYIQTSPALEYVPIVDYSYQILEKFRPYPRDPHAVVTSMNRAPDGTLFFRNPVYGWVTYTDGKFVPGGSNHFYAANGYFYFLYRLNNSVIAFEKSRNPDIYGVAISRTEKTIDIKSDIISSARLLNGGSGQNLYVLLNLGMEDDYELRQFDLKYKMIDKIDLSMEPAYENWTIDPFVRRDGVIYEFRTREDGLHVVRWSKE